MFALRSLIFECAATTPGVGELEETLKWGQPSYLTPYTGSGSTVRLGWSAKAPDQVALYFHCQTPLVETFRVWFPNELEFEGKRSIIIRNDAALAIEELRVCIAAALTYHVNKHTGSLHPKGIASPD